MVLGLLRIVFKVQDGVVKFLIFANLPACHTVAALGFSVILTCFSVVWVATVLKLGILRRVILGNRFGTKSVKDE
jgi:hypothetical protein